MSLTQGILDQHAVAGRPAGAGETALVRPDLLLADRETAALVLGRFAASAQGPPALDCLVASDRQGVPAWSGGDPAFAKFQQVVRASGARLAPPRSGDRRALAFESLAAPGRLLATLGPAPEAGALGALMLPVGELEALGLLCGEPLELSSLMPAQIELTGELPARCEGHDVAGALIAANPAGWSGLRIEFSGPGVASLTIADRMDLCRALVAAGAESVIFPSDDRVREHLRARGRDSDWRRTEPGPAGAGARTFDLGWTVPYAISCVHPSRAVPLAWWAEVALAAVDVGPGFTLDSLARFHALLRGREVDPRVSLRIRAWAAEDGTAPEAAGLRQDFLARGALWIGEGALSPWVKRAGSLRLHAGLPLDPGDSDEEDWGVSLAAAAEAACAGFIAPPEQWADPAGVAIVAGPLRIPAPLPTLREAAPSAGPSSAQAQGAPRHRAGTRRADPLLAVMRGPVLGRLDGDLDHRALLARGPRLAEWIADSVRMAEHVVPSARRAKAVPGAPGGWLIVLGEVRGIEGGEAGLLALAATGVRAVLAAGFEPRSRVLFSRAGLLALRVLNAAHLDAIHPGDELELVGGLDAFAHDRARVVRNLSRAFAIVALPEQSAREWQWVATGGVARLTAPQGMGSC